MMHRRQTIRAAVVSTVTGLTTTGANVHDSPFYAMTVSPGLAVWALDEPVLRDEETFGKRIKRELLLAIEGWSKKTSGLMNEIDTIAEEVEVAMATDPTLGGLALYSELARSSISWSSDSDKPVAKIRLEWRVVYTTLADDPSVA